MASVWWAQNWGQRRQEGDKIWGREINHKVGKGNSVLGGLVFIIWVRRITWLFSFLIYIHSCNFFLWQRKHVWVLWFFYLKFLLGFFFQTTKKSFFLCNNLQTQTCKVGPHTVCFRTPRTMKIVNIYAYSLYFSLNSWKHKWTHVHIN